MKFNENEDVFQMLWTSLWFSSFFQLNTERHHSFQTYNCIFYNEKFIIGRCSNTYIQLQHYVILHSTKNCSFPDMCMYVFQVFGSFSAGKEIILHGFNKPLLENMCFGCLFVFLLLFKYKINVDIFCFHFIEICKYIIYEHESHI